MEKQEIIDHILSDAQIINKLHANIHKTLINRAEDPAAWHEACRIFHASFDNLAFPGGLARGLELLKDQNPTAITIATTYLEADPLHHRSGYIKQIIVRLLKKAPLSPEQIKQLHDILITTIKTNGRREFKEYCRLARKIKDIGFQERIEEIIKQSHNPVVISRAKLMLCIMCT